MFSPISETKGGLGNKHFQGRALSISEEDYHLAYSGRINGSPTKAVS